MSDNYPNGNQPVSQMTRDNMAQADHDKLVEYGVVLQNILASQTRLEQQIKDLVSGQATALATWEATSKATHDAQDARIRKLEDLATQYVPLVTQFSTQIGELQKGYQDYIDYKNAAIGGWRMMVIITGSITGLLAFVYMLVNIATSCLPMVCKLH